MSVRKRLFVDRSERRFEFWDGDRLVRAGKVAVGAPGAETPIGLFYVQSKFTPAAEILGAYASETSAYSKLSDWPGGGIVGVQRDAVAVAPRAERLARVRPLAQ